MKSLWLGNGRSAILPCSVGRVDGVPAFGFKRRLTRKHVAGLLEPCCFYCPHKPVLLPHTRSSERSGMGAICEHNEPEEIVSRERSALHPDQFTGVHNLVRSSLTGYHVGAMFRILSGARHNDSAVWFRPISSSRFKVRAFKPSRAHASQTTPRT